MERIVYGPTEAVHFFVSKESTVDCTVRFRAGDGLIDSLRHAFRQPKNRETLKFSTCEVVPQGNNWWDVYGDQIHVDAAQVIVQHVDWLLNYTPSADAVVEEAVDPGILRAIYRKPRLVVCRQIPTGKIVRDKAQYRSIAVNRALSAAQVLLGMRASERLADLREAHDQVVVSSIRTLEQYVAPLPFQEQVQALQSHFR